MPKILTDEERKAWAEIPFHKRYSTNVNPNKSIVKRMRQIDNNLDLKFHLPTESWHLVRFPHGRSNGKFVIVWQLVDDPERGLRAEVGEWIIEGLRAADMQNQAEKRLEEIDAHNAAIEESNQRAMAIHQVDYAKEIRKPLQKLYDYGDVGYKGVY